MEKQELVLSMWGWLLIGTLSILGILFILFNNL
jgi:hypothetical protein